MRKGRSHFAVKALLSLLIVAGVFQSAVLNAESAKFKFQHGHTEQIRSVDLSFDDKLAVSTSNDSSIILWDVGTGKELRVFNGHRERVFRAVFSPDGKQILSGGQDKTIKLWDVNSGETVNTYRGHTETVVSVVFTHDNRYFISIANDYTIRIWKRDQSKPIRTINVRPNVVSSNQIIVSRDNQSFFVGYGDFTVKQYDFHTGKITQEFPGHSGHINGMAISDDNKWLVTGSYDGTVKVWDLETGAEYRSFEDHDGIVSDVAVTKDGKYAVSSSVDETVAVWDIEGDEMFQLYEDHESEPTCVAIAGNGKFVVSGAMDSRLKIWELASAVELKSLEGNSAWANSAKFLGNANQILFASEDSTLKLWDFSKARVVKVFKGHEYWVNSLDISRDFKMAVSGADDGNIIFWEIASGKPLHIIKGPGGMIQKVAISPNGKRILSVTSNNKLMIWDLAKRKPVRTFQGHGKNILDAVFTLDSRSVIFSELLGNVVRYNIATGKKTGSFNEDWWTIKTLAISKDGRRLLLGSNNDKIYLFDLLSQKVKQVFTGHGDEIEHVAFSNNENSFLSASKDLTVKLWKISSSQPMKTFSGHTGIVKTVQFSPDGNRIISGGYDGSIKLWKTNGELLLTAVSKDKDWILFTPGGYFDANKAAGELVHMVKDRSVFGIDQFAIKFNRPDILLNRVDSREEKLKGYFYSLYQKRLAKAGFKETQLESDYHIPKVDILNVVQKDSKATVTFKITDSKYPLHSYNFFVNDVQLFDEAERRIRGNSYQGQETIALNAGQNKIEISAFNQSGAESFRALTHLNTNKKSTGDLYYIGFGVSRYKDPQLNLAYAHKDALDLKTVFSKMAGKQFRKTYLHTFINESVTVDRIEQSKQLLKNATVDDTLVLFLAGHGLYEKAKKATYYFLTHDADLDNLAETAADFELIEDLLVGIAPRNKLFLIDTCESGELDETDKLSFIQVAQKSGIKARTYRGIKLSNRVRQECGLERDQRGIVLTSKTKASASCPQLVSRYYLYDTDRFIHNDLFRRSGAIVFTSSQGGELSYESDVLKNGFFTEELINAFSSAVADSNRDGMVSIDEIRDYVIETVPKITQEAQHPVVERDNIYRKFSFPLVEN